NERNRFKKLHLSHQQYKLLNQAHKTRFALKSSHSMHKTSLKDNSKNTRSDRNVVKEAADEVIGSVDTDELAKYFSFKSDPEDEGLRFVSMFPVSFLLTQNPQETELLRYYLLFYGIVRGRQDLSSL
ncbi:hypothetical protein LOK49_Contig462G00003, partial [Camellia lanceoleosa]